jgi:hypothetical protein
MNDNIATGIGYLIIGMLLAYIMIDVIAPLLNNWLKVLYAILIMIFWMSILIVFLLSIAWSQFKKLL